VEYKLKMEDMPLPVTVNEVGEGSFAAVMGEQAYRVEFVRTSDKGLMLTVNGRQLPVVAVDHGEGKTIVINGRQYGLIDEDTLALSGTGRKSARKKPLEVTPPMPAVVVRIAVSPGDRVTEGQPVVVVSAMKMETTLYAPFDGVVTSVNVAAGDKVAPGDILVDIQKTDAAGEPQGGTNE
jgi:biotin carboxyl carrier protein